MTASNDHETTAPPTPGETPGGAPTSSTRAGSTAQEAQQPGPGAPVEELDEDERPTPPRIPKVRKKSGDIPRRHSEDVPVAAAPPAPPLPPEPTAPTPEPEPESAPPDLEWMPPPDADRVARFLSEVAGMEPPPLPAREREAGAPPAFLPPLTISPEQARRKKAKAEPFLSQVLAAPMAPSRATRPKASRRRRQRRLIWLAVILTLLLLALAAAAMLAITHPKLLHLNALLTGSALLLAGGLAHRQRAPGG